MQAFSVFSSQKIIAFVLFISLVIAGVYFLGGKTNKEVTNKAEVATVSTPNLTKRQIAESILQWMNNTRTDNGGYAEAEECGSDGICDPLIQDNRIGALGLWAHYQNYIKHRRFETLPLISSDLKVYSDSKLVNTIQPAFWNCKLLYEMWKSSLFTAKDKNAMQGMCARAVYLLLDVPPKPNISTLHLPIIRSAIEGKISPSAFNGVLDKKYFSEYAAISSEHVYMYLWNKDLGSKGEEDLAQAQTYFTVALELYMKNPADYTEDLPILGITALDISTVVPAPEYLSFAKFIAERVEKKPCASAHECVLRMYLASDLYRSTNSNIYLQSRERLLHQMYSEMFDFQGLKGYSLGRGALNKKGTKNIYGMVTNALFSGLLSREE
ncbi:hypothetical protein COY90_02335 [Candidatus Roizmanbacteria bacterium CG_4_10_14_0_8_um_filter_39_9]|uniref:Uncharacterized protein n=1 Tax=Candidatus Roizmanbacteria bacterium CG_4_10_14_0_8_um_filter_39_9 TaxID=1974829 RepID=A0A2M7QD09_9BACT|nr:MAG: hypothetical protein COY90_02335 [Candidatus Roizmanbacteria bacterium CG_4_10_14_0_8_um_filter_39_9]